MNLEIAPVAWLVVLFWAGVCATLYAYALFPALLALVPRMRREGPLTRRSGRPPRVTMIIPAHNEERNIGGKLQNVLNANYPRDLLEVIVVSDASTDRTDDIVRTFSRDRIRLLVQNGRRGKTAGLNRAIVHAHGEIVIFTDANAVYGPEAIRTLVRYFDDPRVGLVSGYTRYTLGADGSVGEATNAYTSLERVIKRGESRWGRCVGADGAIFAIRRRLYRTLLADDINDFVIPLGVFDQGYRCVLADDAFCSESTGASVESEFRRQSRITNRTLRALWRNLHLLNPFRYPLLAFFLLSHKVVRLLSPVLLLGSLVAAVLLTAAVSLPLGVMAVIAAAALGAGLRRLRTASPGLPVPLRRLVRYADIFITINVAVLHGWWKFLSGRTDVTWQHDRTTA